MVAFDAERYLRMLGERELLGSEQRHHHESRLQGPAAALVAAEQIDVPTARRVLDDYLEAGAVRSEQGYFRRQHQASRSGGGGRRGRGRRLTARRTAVLDHELEFASGSLHLRYLTLGSGADGASQLRYRWVRDQLADARSASGHRAVMGGGGPMPWGGASPTIVDDRGHTVTVRGGSGGGGDDHWDGALELHDGPAPDTAWLEIEGTRVALHDTTAPCSVTVEPVEDPDPVAGWLWRSLAVGEAPFHRTGDVEPALAALIAAGAVAPDSGLVSQVRAVAAALPDHPRHPGFPGGGGSGRGLPEPWRSLLRRFGADDGPAGAWVIGALTPRVDGVQVALPAMTSDRHGFEVEFEVAPNPMRSAEFDGPTLAWWARDDRGNHHLGAPSSWGGDDAHAAGQLRFWPALDPRATRLDLLPTGRTQRAVVAVTLGDDGRLRG